MTPKSDKGHDGSRISPTAPRTQSISDQQWAVAVKDPGFRAAVDDGLADAKVGRVSPWAEVKKRLGL